VQSGKKMIIKSGNGNDYLVSCSIPQVLLLHPILSHLLELSEGGTDLKEWIETMNVEGIELGNGIIATKEEIKYYYNYLSFLEKNHYFKDVKKYNMTGKRYSAQMVEFYLANTQQIVFEVTDLCNLRCRYCGYGDLYTGYDKRENRTLNIETAKILLDYMVELFESPLNRKIHKRIAVSFYGGEPLLNMPFIKDMVSYAKTKKLSQKEFFFSMTTNAIDLEKHMDYLVENDFHLLISLDGDEKNNGYRVFPNGSPSYKIVYNNILKLKDKYPDYYEKRVNFNSVLHNKNSNRELNAFFRKHFGKDPLISEVNSIGIKPEKKDEFNKIFKRMYKGLQPRDIIEDIKDKDRILKTPFVKQLSRFIHRYSGFVFKNYDRMLHKKENVLSVTTGTCNPFEKKIFITTNGKILPCERISQVYYLGKVDGNGVRLDFNEIADKYNSYYKKMMKRCNRCSNGYSCMLCIFTLNLNEDNLKCNNFKSEDKFNLNLYQSISLLEETPQYYPRIMRDYQIN
jgi:uncharacterized protein